jgi:hypothetical protein
LADQSAADTLRLLVSPLKPEDSELRWMLVALAVAFLAEVVVVNLRGGAGLLVLLSTWLAGLVLFGIVVLRLRHHRYSEGGFLGFLLTVLVFQFWTAVVSWIAVLTWSPSWHVYHLALIEASAALPLLAGIYSMSRRLTRTS